MSLAGPLGLLFGWINDRDQIGQKSSLTILNTGRRSGIGSVGFCCKTAGGISVGAESHACAMRLKMRPLAIVSQEVSLAALAGKFSAAVSAEAKTRVTTIYPGRHRRNQRSEPPPSLSRFVASQPAVCLPLPRIGHRWHCGQIPAGTRGRNSMRPRSRNRLRRQRLRVGSSDRTARPKRLAVVDVECTEQHLPFVQTGDKAGIGKSRGSGTACWVAAAVIAGASEPFGERAPIVRSRSPPALTSYAQRKAQYMQQPYCVPKPPTLVYRIPSSTAAIAPRL